MISKYKYIEDLENNFDFGINVSKKNRKTHQQGRGITFYKPPSLSPSPKLFATIIHIYPFYNPSLLQNINKLKHTKLPKMQQLLTMPTFALI